MLIAFALTPMGVEENGAAYVADAIKIIRESGLPNRSDSMYTMIEGDWDEVMDVVKRATEAVADRVPRVQASIRIDVWPGMDRPLDGKISMLERRVADNAAAAGALDSGTAAAYADASGVPATGAGPAS
ncbi:MTH1187 family thiamine-binding protein [Streptomyces chrestomyceticus]|uniref:MTH1187 family thiamine-binding protein n=1 Tax=Streptomyces chrestomyceticus TaxID=68185 RepID=A0ABU7WYY2_9ACTN